MSRIGKQPVNIPDKVTVSVKDNVVVVKGPKGELSKPFPKEIGVVVDAGYVASARKAEREGLPVLELTLKYVAGVPAITSIERVSTPGRRIYAGYSSVPKVIGGMGVSILTTSRGVMTDAEARRQKVGGELLAKVW